MGISQSIEVHEVFQSISSWKWEKIEALCRSYSDEIHGFALNASGISSLSGISDDQAENVVAVLSRHSAPIVNAMTFLVTICILGKCDDNKARLNRIFDLFDFDKLKQVNIDELTILLLCTANALSTVLQVEKTCPTDTATRDLAESIYDDMRKPYKDYASRTAVVNWMTVELRKLPSINIADVYNLLFRGRVRVKPSAPTEGSVSGILSSVDDESITVATQPVSAPPPVKPKGEQKIRLGEAPPQPETNTPRTIDGRSESKLVDDTVESPVQFEEPKKEQLLSPESQARVDKRIPALDNGVLEVFSVEVCSVDYTGTGDIFGKLFGQNTEALVEMKLDDGSRWRHETEVKTLRSGREGGRVRWKELHVEGPVQRAELDEGCVTLRVEEVKHESGEGNRKLIGKAKLQLQKLSSCPDEWIDVPADLLDKDGRDVVGLCRVKIRYRVHASELVYAHAGEESGGGIVEVCQVAVSHLNTKSSVNVFAELKIGDGSEWCASTDTETDVSGEVVWMTKLSGPVSSANELAVDKLKILIWQKDPNGRDELIGRAVVTDSLLLFAHATKWVQLMGELQDKADMKVGSFSITARYVSIATKFMSAAAKFISSSGSVNSGLNNGDESAEENVEGYLDLYDIHITSYSELPVDVVAQIKVGSGDAWNHRTEVSWGQSDGSTISWYPQVTLPVTRTAIFSRGIKLRLRAGEEDAVVAKAELGDGSPLFEYENHWVLLTGNLLSILGEVNGSYATYMKYRPAGTQPNFSADSPRDSVSGNSWSLETPKNMRGHLDIYDINIDSDHVAVDESSRLKAQVKVGDGTTYNFCTSVTDTPGGDGVRVASWLVKLTRPVSRPDVFSGGIKLRLRVENDQGQDMVMAKGALGDGSPLFEYENQWVMLTGNLHGRDGAIVGSYSSYMKYRPEGSSPDFSYDTPRDDSPRALVRSETTAVAPVEDSQELGSLESASVMEMQGGFLEVQYLRLSHLMNVEGLFRGANDVFALISLGDGEGAAWQHQTSVRREAGSHASWVDSFSGRVPLEVLHQEKVILNVKDKNTDHDTPIGKASVNISPLSLRPNEWVEFDGDLKHDRKISGQYFVRMRYRTRPDRPDKEALHVRKITLSQIIHHDGGFFSSKKDVYVELQVGDGSLWKRESEVQDNVGADAAWPNLNLFGHLDRSILSSEMLTITVRDNDPDNFDKVVGIANVRLSQLENQIGDWVEINGELHRDIEQQLSGVKKPDGRFTITMKYVS